MEKNETEFEKVVYFQEGPGVRNWQFRDSGIKLINIRNLVDDVLFLDNTSNFLDEEEVNTKYKHFLLNAGDFVMASSGVTWGKIAEVKECNLPLCLNTSVIRLLSRNDDVLDKWYLYYFIKSPEFRRQIEKLITGSAQPNFGPSHLKKVYINLPRIDIQKEAVSYFVKLEKIIKDRQIELNYLDELIKARFVELFGEQERNPFGFKKETIGDCCTLKSGTSLPAEKENEGGNIPYVKVGDMNYPGNERYITTSSRYVTEETAGKGLFEVGTVIFPKRGGAIGTNKKRMTTVPICADLNVMGVSSKGEVLPEYLLAYFDDIDMGALSDGSSVPQINNKNIAPLTILIPPIELQREFVRFIKQVDKSKVVVQKALDEAQLLFDSLMQEYFG